MALRFWVCRSGCLGRRAFTTGILCHVRLQVSNQACRDGLGDRYCPDHSGCPVFDAHNRYLLPLALFVCMFVLLASAQIHSVRLNRTGELILSRQGAPRISKPVQQVPCRALPYAQIAVQLHAGYALRIRGCRIRGYGPFPVADLGAFHDGPGLDAKVMLAIGTIVRHVRVLCNTGPVVLVMGARAPVRSYVALKPPHGGLFVGEHLEQIF